MARSILLIKVKHRTYKEVYDTGVLRAISERSPYDGLW